MKPQDFKDFASVAMYRKYDSVPFTSSKNLLFKLDASKMLSYKTALSEDSIAKKFLQRKLTRHQSQYNLHFKVAEPAFTKPSEGISQQRKQTSIQCCNSCLLETKSLCQTLSHINF
ncbi:unnamed protein product [Lepeophtheirus salmonis]|uniref:(salmon louse) hypothetical protein n=1 Tax=Lepeophtheirus salmonis TaxID=72036 RepID=A0A7R8CQF0_LEPSM|nr:unnamed protein product [Lepeophtheirus salmonis]CAF2894736.1 unnamed protein product [Lepeophtheirus salmonis]